MRSHVLNSVYLLVPRVLNILVPALLLFLLSYIDRATEFARISLFMSTSVVVSMLVDAGSYVGALNDVNKSEHSDKYILNEHVMKKLLIGAVVSMFSFALWILSYISATQLLAIVNGAFLGMYALFMFQYSSAISDHVSIDIIARLVSAISCILLYKVGFDVVLLMILFLLLHSAIRFGLYLRKYVRNGTITLQRLEFSRLIDNIRRSKTFVISNITNGATSDIFILLSSSLGERYVVAISISQYGYKALKMLLNILSTVMLAPIVFGGALDHISKKLLINFFILYCLVTITIYATMSGLIYLDLFSVEVAFEEILTLLILASASSIVLFPKVIYGYPLFMKFKLAGHLARTDLMAFMLNLVILFTTKYLFLSAVLVGLLFLCFETVTSLLRVYVFHMNFRR